MADHDFMKTALARTEEALAFAGRTITELEAEIKRLRDELEEAYQRIYDLSNGS